MNDIETFDDSQFLLNIPDSERDAEMSRQVRKMMWPWVKSPFLINNFENRYKAHEKMLQEQQKMIKDQQRLIEDLKYQQSQTAFKEQIALLEQIKQKQDELERMQKVQYNQERKLLMEATKNNVKINNEEKTDDVSEFEEPIEQDRTQTDVSNKKTIDTKRTPRFLKSMEERAKQREQLRFEREERKRQQENEKLKQMQAKQEEKLRIEEEERRKKNEELKEKRRCEKELKNKRDAERLREQELNDKADLHYKKYLMRHYCLGGFQKLSHLREEQKAIAEEHYKLRLYNKCVEAWRSIVNEQIQIKEQIADIFYKKYLVRHYFIFGWKNFKMSIHFEQAKAARFYKYNLKMKIYNAIKLYTKHEKIKYKEYDSWLDSYYNERLRVKCFKKWKEFPNELKKIREREKRLTEMRKKVQELVPDFHVTSLTESSTTTQSFVEL